jgi:hypothetical protein
VVGVVAGVVVFGVLGVVFEPLEGVVEAGLGVLAASGIFGGVAGAPRAGAGATVVGVPGFGVACGEAAGGGVVGVGLAGVGVIGVGVAGDACATIRCTRFAGWLFNAA